MHIPVRSLTSGFSMPALGKGTWMAGTKKKTYQNIDEAVLVQAIMNAIDNGITYIDTAERYGNGYGEELVGKAIKGKDRGKLFITSKLSSKHHSYEEVVLAARRTLNRLHTNYLDLYFIHYYDKRVSLQETMRAMDNLIKMKLIKQMGVCNFTVEQLVEVQSYTKNKIVVNQLKYNFFSRNSETRKVVKYCQENDIMVIAWKPYPQNLLTEQTTVSLKNLAQKYDKTMVQVAYTWLTQQKNIVLLADLLSEKEIEAVQDTFTLTFTPKELEELDGKEEHT